MSTHVASNHNSETKDLKKLLLLTISALGVVYGDIGTSPLYAMKECFHGNHAIALTQGNIFGVLSLVFWSLTLVVTIKYLIFIMSADNHGEGGIFALLALIPSNKEKINPKIRTVGILAGLMGASLLYGDGVITPAISVLSAVEGLEVATAAAKPFIVPITCVILFSLFSVQKKGTGKIGSIFGIFMFFWFTALAILGLKEIIHNPTVLQALNPYYAINFFLENGIHGFVVLASVVLCITGGEALYADMGHFGRKPIKISWFSLVFPALLLNYMGQGALLLTDPSKASNPFYGLVPSFLIYPMVFLSTAATIIASQALISGAFSITRQAIQLGYMPRVNITHTSEDAEGQIFISIVNKLLMVACIAIVLVFKESSNLASAYGLAVTADMVITSCVFFIVTRYNWGWALPKSLSLSCFFLLFDATYFGSNLLKFFDGGWFPTVIAFIIFNFMLVWKDGRAELGKQIKSSKLPMDISTKIRKTQQLNSQLAEASLASQTSNLSEDIENINISELSIKDLLPGLVSYSIARIPGTGVFMTVSLTGVPPVLAHQLKHTRVLNKTVVLLSIKSADSPYVKNEDRIELFELGHGFYQIRATYGFMETPNVVEIMKLASVKGLHSEIDTTTFYLGREVLISSDKKKSMMKWRKTLFALMSRNALSATSYFSIPPNRVVEIGMQFEL